MDLPEFNFNISNLGAALNIIASMITPALLISATGTLILSTSNRLSRVIDRLRVLSDLVETVADPSNLIQLRGERLDFWQQVIFRQARRLHILQRVLTLLYLAVAAFIFCSVSIGVVSISFRFYWIPVALGILGACFLLVSSVYLLIETRLSVRGMEAETDFHLRLASHYVALNVPGNPPAGASSKAS